MSKPFFKIDRNKKYQHSGRHGTNMESERTDLLGKNVLIRPAGISDAAFAEDMAEIIGWWCVNIREDMLADHGGYPGFGSVHFEVQVMQDCIEVEYDPEYCGGDYSGVGKKVMIPVSLIDELCCNTTDIGAAFKKVTNLDPIHIIHHSNEVVEAPIPEKGK